MIKQILCHSPYYATIHKLKGCAGVMISINTRQHTYIVKQISIRVTNKEHLLSWTITFFIYIHYI